MGDVLTLAKPDDEQKAALREALIALTEAVESGEVVGLFAVCECRGYRRPLLAGDIDSDGILGFTLRVLNSVGNGAS